MSDFTMEKLLSCKNNLDRMFGEPTPIKEGDIIKYNRCLKSLKTWHRKNLKTIAKAHKELEAKNAIKEQRECF